MSVIFKPPGPLKTAVLFLVFNRPDTTARVFKAIRQAKPPRLYVAADGARNNKIGETEKVQAVREYILQNIDWDCEVKTLFREDNLGCKYAVSGAISWFFENEEQGIILEDDCLPSQSFFWFCEEMLNRYQKDKSIYHIGGYTLQSSSNYTYRFSRLVPIWGWATWRRAWKKYDINMMEFDLDSSIYNCFGKYSKDVQNTFRNHLVGDVDTWDTQWAFSCVRDKAKTVIPSVSLIKNIGFNEDATHTTKKDKINGVVENKEISFPLKEVQLNEEIIRSLDEDYLKTFYKKTIASKIKSTAKKIFKWKK